MSEAISLPSIEQLKEQARRMRIRLAANGESVSHSKALELLSHHRGYKDWNSLHAVVDNHLRQCPVKMGERVSGSYMGQSFKAEVTGINILVSENQFRISLVFDEAIDAVKFEGMSALRKNVSCTIDADGKTQEKTSDGIPHLVLDIGSNL